MITPLSVSSPQAAWAKRGQRRLVEIEGLSDPVRGLQDRILTDQCPDRITWNNEQDGILPYLVFALAYRSSSKDDILAKEIPHLKRRSTSLDFALLDDEYRIFRSQALASQETAFLRAAQQPLPRHRGEDLDQGRCEQPVEPRLDRTDIRLRKAARSQQEIYRRNIDGQYACAGARLQGDVVPRTVDLAFNAAAPPARIDGFHRAFEEIEAPIQSPTAPQQPPVRRKLDQARVFRRRRKDRSSSRANGSKRFEQVRQHGHIFSNSRSCLCQPFSLSTARNAMSFL